LARGLAAAGRCQRECASLQQGSANRGEEEAKYEVSFLRLRYSAADSRHFRVIHSADAIVKNNTLGPAIESFGPHFRISLALIGIGGLFSWLAFDAAKEEPTRVAWTVFYGLAIGFGLLVVRHLAFRLWLHERGISYRGILGKGEILWRDIDRIYVGAYSIQVHHFALGTFYRLRLITKQGAKLSIGERVHRAETLADSIHSYTLQEMVRKAVSEFEGGVELDFGRIRINRKTGVIYRKWFAWREIRWPDLATYGFSDTHVNLKGAQQMLPANIAAEKVSNVHVLEALLDGVRKGELSIGLQ